PPPSPPGSRYPLLVVAAAGAGAISLAAVPVVVAGPVVARGRIRALVVVILALVLLVVDLHERERAVGGRAGDDQLDLLADRELSRVGHMDNDLRAHVLALVVVVIALVVIARAVVVRHLGAGVLLVVIAGDRDRLRRRVGCEH